MCSGDIFETENGETPGEALLSPTPQHLILLVSVNKTRLCTPSLSPEVRSRPAGARLFAVKVCSWKPGGLGFNSRDFSPKISGMTDPQLLIRLLQFLDCFYRRRAREPKRTQISLDEIFIVLSHVQRSLKVEI